MRWATNLVKGAGALGLLLAMLAENVFPPIPSEVVLPFAGFLVGRGELSLLAALAAATAGSTLGALALYAVGRWGGRGVLLRWRGLFRLTEEDLDRADDWFDRHGWKFVLFGRMVPLVRSAVSVPAGTSEMPLGRFTLLTATGSAAWNGVLIGLGVGFGERYEQIAGVLGTGSRIVLVAVTLAAVGAVVWWYRSRSRQEVDGSDARSG